MKNIIETIKKTLQDWYDIFKKMSSSVNITPQATEKYVTSPFFDSNDVLIKEGDIIIADGYGTTVLKNYEFLHSFS